MLVLALFACAPPPDPVPLRWVRGWEGETWEHAERGLYWQLAALGAFPPEDGSALEVAWTDADGAGLGLRLDRLGLPGGVPPELAAVAAEVAASDEAATFGGVDLGRFVLRTLYDPEVYYAVTGVPDTLPTWRRRWLGGATPLRYDVTDSLISAGPRTVWLAPYAGVATTVASLAEEEAGGETLDLMPNGQFRYASWDVDGRRVAALDPAVAATGLPGKCLWCHEGSLQMALGANDPGPGSLSTEAFLDELRWRQAGVEALRRSLGVAVDWDGADGVHAWGELLTETFLAPTPARLAREWGWAEEEVWAALDPATLHENPEYPEHGLVTTRVHADAVLAAAEPGYTALEVPASAREP